MQSDAGTGRNSAVSIRAVQCPKVYSTVSDVTSAAKDTAHVNRSASPPPRIVEH